MTTRIRVSLLAAALCCAPALSLDAQIIRVPKAADAKRAVSANVHAGFFQTAGRFDQTGELWSLGEAFQYRGSVDVGLRSGSLGLTGTVATVPIIRSGPSSGRGDIQFRQLMGTFRSPEGQGFFQLLEVSAGLSQWANYTGTGALPPGDEGPRNGFTFVIGYGFGFGLGERMSFTVVQDAGTVIGSAEGLPAGARRSQAQYTTRMGLRYRFTGTR